MIAGGGMVRRCTQNGISPSKEDPCVFSENFSRLGRVDFIDLTKNDIDEEKPQHLAKVTECIAQVRVLGTHNIGD
jgi:hypothetical protein